MFDLDFWFSRELADFLMKRSALKTGTDGSIGQYIDRLLFAVKSLVSAYERHARFPPKREFLQLPHDLDKPQKKMR